MNLGYISTDVWFHTEAKTVSQHRPIKQEPEQPVKVEKKKDEEVDVNDPFYRGPRPDPFKPGIKIALAPRPERGFYFKLLDSKPILQVWNRCW